MSPTETSSKIYWQKVAAIVAVVGGFYAMFSHMESNHDDNLKKQVVMEQRISELEKDVIALQHYIIKNR